MKLVNDITLDKRYLSDPPPPHCSLGKSGRHFWAQAHVLRGGIPFEAMQYLANSLRLRK